ncbi:hypothetical protein L1987_79771 [Smallanthus sonchifolius]|uniref:Uncharacterized protein n=1 Tax=Smallanthus sonchifolius TaxID=185202 RepID=A0ACB8YLH6_9ASTR|nr:hypothetical protein L1987_79771 [Smallanthus sonchifolius]
MDSTEEDMKLVGFFGIFKHSFKTIFSWNKIFVQITLTLILPLTVVYLAHTEISDLFFWRMEDNSSPSDSNNQNTTVTDWLYYWLFNILYFTLITVFSLLSTATVVFTVASVYSDRDVVFRQVMKIVPQVWKKLLLTFVFIYITLFIYNVMNDVVTFISRSVFGYSIYGTVIILILYVLGLLYLTVVWQLASVVTVLENIRGFNAMKKGKMLVNGKKIVGMGIAFVLYGILLGLITVYQLFVEFGDEISGLATIWRVLIGILCVILLTMLFLLFIVMQTVLYLVCKSYHREAVDKLGLLTFLSAYMAETVVYGEEIQLGKPQPPAEQV